MHSVNLSSCMSVCASFSSRKYSSNALKLMYVNQVYCQCFALKIEEYRYYGSRTKTLKKNSNSLRSVGKVLKLHFKMFIPTEYNEFNISKIIQMNKNIFSLKMALIVLVFRAQDNVKNYKYIMRIFNY